jgi:hypothetical protein
MACSRGPPESLAGHRVWYRAGCCAPSCDHESLSAWTSERAPSPPYLMLRRGQHPLSDAECRRSRIGSGSQKDCGLLYPALGPDLTPSPTACRAQARSGVRARSARKGSHWANQHGDIQSVERAAVAPAPRAATLALPSPAMNSHRRIGYPSNGRSIAYRDLGRMSGLEPIFFAPREAALGPQRRWRSPDLAAGCWGSSAATVAPCFGPTRQEVRPRDRVTHLRRLRSRLTVVGERDRARPHHSAALSRASNP